MTKISKVHLLDLREPLLLRYDVEVRCGHKLREAEVQLSYGVYRPEDLRKLGLQICSKCLDTMPKIDVAELTYLYLLSEKYKFQFEELEEAG